MEAHVDCLWMELILESKNHPRSGLVGIHINFKVLELDMKLEYAFKWAGFVGPKVLFLAEHGPT